MGKTVKTLYTIGEALIDFIPSNAAVPLEEVEAFSPKVGGAPCNVAAAYALHTGKSTLLTAVGNDAFGNKIIETLKACRVDTSRIVKKEDAKTGLAFVGLDHTGDRSFSFYRSPSADMLYGENDLPDALDDAFALHFCSVALKESPMKDAHKKAIALAKKAGAFVSFDVNLRFSLWDDETKLYRTVWEFLPLADIVKLSEEEVEFVTGEKSLVRAAKTLLFHCRYVIITQGKNGATFYYTDESEKDFGMRSLHVTPPEMQSVDTTGAGDAFIAAFLFLLSEQEDPKALPDEDKLEQLLYYSCRFATATTQYHGAIDSYRNVFKLSHE